MMTSPINTTAVSSVSIITARTGASARANRKATTREANLYFSQSQD
jgi:hypothetical protein